MAVAYTIPGQTIDSHSIPSTVFTVYTGDISINSSESLHFDNILLAVVLLEPDTDNYIVLQASRTTFSSFVSPNTYTYDGKTVYWVAFPWPPGSVITFNPDLPTNIKTANTEMDSIGRYTAWLMVYGGYIATFSELEETANAIRAKTGSSAAIEWEAGEGFKDAIAAIQTGVDGLEYALHFSSPSSFTLETGYRSANWDGSIEWTDGAHAWAVWDGNAILTASSGVLYLRGINNTGITGSSNQFVLTGTNISCDGNIETLLDYATVALGNHPTMNAYCYGSLFENCTGLISAPDLPATTLTEGCYEMMFSGCSNLKSAPMIAATTLDEYCCENMFYGCTSLTSAPALLATTLAYGCYSSMFSGCTSLKSAPALPATTLAQSCYSSMFEGCTSLTSVPTLPATTLVRGCYQWMFQGCTSLTSPPILPADTLAIECYYQMFEGCTSLTSPPALPATTLADYCYQEMFKNCTALASLPILPAITLTNYCYYQMFYGCSGIKLAQTYDSTYYPYAFRIPESGTGTETATSLINMFASTGGSWSGQPIINRVYYLRKPIPIDFTVDGNAAAADVRLGKIAYANGARVSGSMMNGTATAPASITGTGSSVSTGTNTLTLSKTVSVTPSVTTAGYISSGTAGNSSVSLTASVTTKAAATYTPTTSNQTIAAGTYLTGAQTIAGNANLVAGNIKSGVSIFGVTGTFAGDATVYNNAYTSRAIPEVDTSHALGLRFPLQYPAALSFGDYALFSGGQWNDGTYMRQSVETVYFTKTLSTGRASAGLQGTSRFQMRAEQVGNYALFFGGNSSASYQLVDSYDLSFTHGTPTNLSFTTFVNPTYSCTVGNYALIGMPSSTPVMNAYNTSLTRSIPTALPSNRYNINAAHIGNYAIFGASASSNVVNTYNTALTRGTATAFTTARDSYGAGTVGNYALFAAGNNSVMTVECYTSSLTHSVAATSFTYSMYILPSASLGDYVIFGGAGYGSSAYVEYYSTTLTHGVCTNRLDYYNLSTIAGQPSSACSVGGYALFGGKGVSAMPIVSAPYTLSVSVPANYTYSFNGELPTTVSSATTVTKTNGGPINGIVCKAATTRTGKIT